MKDIILIYLASSYVANFFLSAYLNRLDGAKYEALDDDDKFVLLLYFVASPFTVWFSVFSLVIHPKTSLRSFVGKLSKPLFFLTPKD